MTNKVDLVVLGFLIREPMHGYQIAAFFERHGIEHWVPIKRASVYKSLSRLERDGHLRSRIENQESVRPRKVYSITASGKEYFQELLDSIFMNAEFTSPMDFWNAFRFLGNNIDRAYFDKLIDLRISSMESHRKEMVMKREKKKAEINKNAVPFYVQMLIQHLSDHAGRELELLKSMKKAAELPENADAFIIKEQGRK